MKYMSMRRKRLQGLIHALETMLNYRFDLSKLEDKLLIHKYVYLLNEFGVSMGYSFNRLVRGVYSDELSEDLRRLPQSAEPVELPSKFVEFVKGRDSRWLEFATRLHFISKLHPALSKDECIEIIARYHLDDNEDIRILYEVYNELEKFGLI